MKGILCFLLGVLPVYAFSQTTFSRVYPNGLNGDFFKDLVVVSPQEYAFITRSVFYRVDGQGAVLTQRNLLQGFDTQLESMATDGAGNFYVTGYVSPTPLTGETVLFKLNSQGQLLFTKTIFGGSSHMIRLVPAPNNRLFVAYAISAGNDYVLIVTLLDEQGDPLWKITASDKNQNMFAARADRHGLLHIIYGTRTGDRTMWLQCDGAGNVTEGALLLPFLPNTRITTSNFCPTPDGGLAAVGEITSSPKLGDGLLYKVAANGQVSWHRVFDIHRRDRFGDIVPLADGYVMAGESGLDDYRGNPVAGDLLLLKTDLQGTVLWKSAMGTARTDQSTRILAPDNQHFLLGGRITHPSFGQPVPALFKTNHIGQLLTTLPFQPAIPAGLHRIRFNHPAPVQTLTGIVPADNGSFIGGGNFQHADDDLIYPYLFKADENGREVLHLATTTRPGLLKAVRPSRDGYTFILAEQQAVFGRFYTLIKLASGGNAYWIANFGTSTLRDMIGTADGGCLLVGGEDTSQSDYDLIMIKIDADGNEAWRKKTGLSTHWEIGNRIIETPEHDFIIAGTTQIAFGLTSQGYVAKINSKGGLLWSKTYHTGKVHSQFLDIAPAPDGYVLTGIAGMDYDRKDVWLMRVDRQGNTLWEKMYDLHLQDEGVSLIYTTSDTILVAGNTGEPVAGHLEKYGFLMKLNKDGNPAGIQYFGQAGVQTTITKLWVQEDKLMLAGNAQEEYGKGYMFFAQAGVGTVLPGPQPEPTSQLIVYPNPAHSKAFISMKNNFTGPVNIVLYNTTGQQVMVLQRTKTSFELKEEVPLSHLPSGMYYFFIQHGSDQSVQSIRVINR